MIHFLSKSSYFTLALTENKAVFGPLSLKDGEKRIEIANID